MRMLLLVACLLGSASATPIGTLDVDLTKTEKGYVLSDSTFEVTFPTKPQLDISPTNTPTADMPGFSATLENGSLAYGVSMIAAPHELAYNLARGLAGARDNMLAAIDVYLQWDGDHRTMIIVMGFWKAGTSTASFQDFVASFKRHDSVRWPIDPPAPAENTPEPTKVLDFELVRHGTLFTVRNSLFEATFPTRPLVTKGDASPATGMDARTYLGEADWFSTGVVVVPKDTPFGWS
jgi:hypothetical protein